MKEERNKRKWSRILAALCYAMALVSLLSSFGATLAKYVKKDSSAGTAVAAPFYFSSDKLWEGDRGRHTISEPAAGQPVVLNFAVTNYIDEFRCTAQKIEYEYYAVAGTDPGGTPITSVYTGSLEGVLQSNSHELELRKADFGSGSVTVVARATSPYQKTLSAQFGFDVQLQYNIDIQENAVVVEVAGGSGEDVLVTWPETVTPDRSNPLFNSASDGSVVFAAQPGVRYALTFFRTGEAVLESDFSVSLN